MEDLKNSKVIVDKTTFKFDNNAIFFQKEVNSKIADTEVEHEIEETKLEIVHKPTWTEALFYGCGNNTV